MIESTTRLDTQRHFTKGMEYCQKEDGDLADKKLSEIIQIANKIGFMDKDIFPLLNRAIENFGDITYGEFIKDKFHEIIKQQENSKPFLGM